MALLALFGCALLSAPARAPYPFMDPALPWDTRTADLVGRLTLLEKVAQLGHFNTSTPNVSLGRANSPAIDRLGVGSYNYGLECNSGIIVGYAAKHRSTHACVSSCKHAQRVCSHDILPGS